MRLLAHTITKLRRGYPLANFSLKALYLLEQYAHREMDHELAEKVKSVILNRIDGNPSSPT